MMPSNFLPVSPVKPPAPYLGGKRRLAAQIIAQIGQTPHDTYVEPFVGMGGVFFRRPFRVRAEVINDVSRDVANLFRVLQRHYVPLMDMLRWQITSRTEFERLRDAVPDTLTDLERAVRFLFLQRTAFGGRLQGRTFGVSVTTPARFDVAKLSQILEDVHERLSSVVIECLPYAELIPRYDRPQTLFYLDPPYWGSETDYGFGVFSQADFARMAILLRALKGRFILSLNDRPEVRELFRGLRIEPVKLHYTVNSGGATPAGELLISGP